MWGALGQASTNRVTREGTLAEWSHIKNSKRRGKEELSELPVWAELPALGYLRKIETGPLVVTDIGFI